MRIYPSILLTAVFAAVIACTSNTAGVSNRTASTPKQAADSQHAPTPRSIEGDRISLADAKKAFDAKTAVFVDVRSADAFQQERVSGALNIPIGELDASMNKLPKGKMMIVYCS